MRHAPVAAIVAMIVSPAALSAAPADVRYAPPPAWVLPPPSAPDRPSAPDAPFRVIYLDNQVRIGERGAEEIFTAYRMKVLKPEGLGLGDVTISWLPDNGGATVHVLRIIRDGTVIDELASNKFAILQRENGLEQSVLSGLVTAALQVPGLQIGDELEFAATVERREPAFGGHDSNVAQLPVLGLPGAFRTRLVWPEHAPLAVRTTPDLPAIAPTIARGQKTVSFELRDPAGSIPTEGAPPRYNVRRFIEFSDFGPWTAVSRQLWPSFDAAAKLKQNSAVRIETARIAAASGDPAQRALAALALVQDRIRYVFIGLNGGNYTPAGADDTWTRRYGDCKAKTAILLAMLRELGIDAEAVLVSSGGGDGFDERLPSPRPFDHVLVRAHIKGRSYWLDGTRLGDRYLENIPPVHFRWVLPLTAAGATLEPVAAQALSAPLLTGIVEIDATAGFAVDAKVRARNILRGDEAYGLRMQLAALAPADADRGLTSYWHQNADWIEADHVGWSYDERKAALVLSIEGHGKPGWKGDDQKGHSLTIVGAGFYAPDLLKRPKDQNQAAGWAVDFPRFRCWATTIRLPPSTGKLHWTYSAEPTNRKLGGFAYWRQSGLVGNTIRTVMSTRAYAPEISAADALYSNGQIAGFNNNMSSVDQVSGGREVTDSALPFGDDVDWVNDYKVCSPSA